MEKIRVAIIGQGRSGRDIHGSFLLNPVNDKYEVVAVCELLEHRRERAKKEFGCTVLEDYRELIGMKDKIDLVINASYSHMHYPITKDLLENGISVLCEKPFGATYKECMELIDIAKKNGVHVFAFHQSLIAPYVLNVKEIAESGKIGDIVSLTIRYPGFNHRYDWQTLQCRLAGSLYNTGPHPVGQALDLLGWDDTTLAFAHLSNQNSVGDADDCDKVILTNSKGVYADIEITSCDCLSTFEYKLCGTKGTIKATPGTYTVKYLPDGYELPKLEVESLMNENGHPDYCRENLSLTEESGTTATVTANPAYSNEVQTSSFDQSVKNFYDMMYDTMVNGKDAVVSPEMGAKVIKIIEECHKANPIEQKFFF